MDIFELKKFLKTDKPVITDHALEAMQDDEITLDDLLQCVLHGEIIEEYLKAYPLPACLIKGNAQDGRVLHACLSVPPQVKIITCYIPDAEQWENGFRKRRRK